MKTTLALVTGLLIGLSASTAAAPQITQKIVLWDRNEAKANAKLLLTKIGLAGLCAAAEPGDPEGLDVLLSAAALVRDHRRTSSPSAGPGAAGGDQPASTGAQAATHRGRNAAAA